ncbi:hypothetical protein FOA52_009798 [Chlamydomonas sp. UWO 241]|nr:hypothetical protein FOA52_009798 [Chlamydomonas sp. UWO 241]
MEMEPIGGDDGEHQDDGEEGDGFGTKGFSASTNKKLTSKFRGVCWNKKNKRWQAAINSSGKYLYLGSYDTQEEAGRMFDKAAVRIRGRDKARTNFPSGDYFDANGEVLVDPQVESLLLEACNPTKQRRTRAKKAKPGDEGVDAASVDGVGGGPMQLPQSEPPRTDAMAADIALQALARLCGPSPAEVAGGFGVGGFGGLGGRGGPGAVPGLGDMTALSQLGLLPGNPLMGAMGNIAWGGGAGPLGGLGQIGGPPLIDRNRPNLSGLPGRLKGVAPGMDFSTSLLQELMAAQAGVFPQQQAASPYGSNAYNVGGGAPGGPPAPPPALGAVPSTSSASGGSYGGASPHEGGGQAPSAAAIVNLTTAMLDAISQQLPEGGAIMDLLQVPGTDQPIGVLFAMANTPKIGGGLWNGLTLQAMGAYGTMEDAVQAVTAMQSMMTGGAAARRASANGAAPMHAAPSRTPPPAGMSGGGGGRFGGRGGGPPSGWQPDPTGYDDPTMLPDPVHEDHQPRSDSGSGGLGAIPVAVAAAAAAGAGHKRGRGGDRSIAALLALAAVAANQPEGLYADPDADAVGPIGAGAGAAHAVMGAGGMGRGAGAPYGIGGVGMAGGGGGGGASDLGRGPGPGAGAGAPYGMGSVGVAGGGVAGGGGASGMGGRGFGGGGGGSGGMRAGGVGAGAGSGGGAQGAEYSDPSEGVGGRDGVNSNAGVHTHGEPDPDVGEPDPDEGEPGGSGAPLPPGLAILGGPMAKRQRGGEHPSLGQATRGADLSEEGGGAGGPGGAGAGAGIAGGEGGGSDLGALQQLSSFGVRDALSMFFSNRSRIQ